MDAEHIIGIVFLVINFIIVFLLILSVLLQGGKIRGIGGAIAGTSDSSLFEKQKKSTSEQFSSRITWILGTIFLVLSFIMLILIKYNVIALF